MFSFLFTKNIHSCSDLFSPLETVLFYVKLEDVGETIPS